jgi:hypothetical protein
MRTAAARVLEGMVMAFIGLCCIDRDMIYILIKKVADWSPNNGAKRAKRIKKGRSGCWLLVLMLMLKD